MKQEFLLGYDYASFFQEGLQIPLLVSVYSHLIVVGGSGSGKSTAVLYWLYKIRKRGCKLFIADFKASREFFGIADDFAEFEDSFDLIKRFYQEFMSTPEGGDGHVKILVIDEIAGMLQHFSLSKDGKVKADEIRSMMSNILMLGRSRRCFLWLSMQRYSASIFPSASGSADNFHICVGLGRMTVDGRKSLFAGEHCDEEDGLIFGQGTGIALVDGKPLQTIILPKLSKVKLKKLLQKI